MPRKACTPSRVVPRTAPPDVWTVGVVAVTPRTLASTGSTPGTRPRRRATLVRQAGAPAAAGGAPASSGRWDEPAVQLVSVAGPVQEVLLPRPVEQCGALVQFDLDGEEVTESPPGSQRRRPPADHRSPPGLSGLRRRPAAGPSLDRTRRRDE